MTDARLSILLAMALGSVGTYALMARDAVGYPAGPAVSTGHNPVVNYGGTIYDYGDVLLFTAPTDQDVVITDVILSSGEPSSQCRGLSHVAMIKGSTSMAEFHVGLSWRYSSGTGYTYSDYQSQTKAHFQSGLRVPAGESLTMDVARLWGEGCGSGMDVAYVVSGYLAQS